MPPVNDVPANAITITTSGTIAVTTVDAANPDSFGSNWEDVWYRFAPSQTTALRLNFSSDTPGVFPFTDIYTATNDPPLNWAELVFVNSSGANEEEHTAPQALRFEGGEVYWLNAYGWTGAAVAEIEFDMDVQIVTRPPNDDVVDAIVLNTPGCNTATVTTVNATHEDIPGSGWDDDFPSVWYRVEAQDDGDIIFAVLGNESGVDSLGNPITTGYCFRMEVWIPSISNPATPEDVLLGTLLGQMVNNPDSDNEPLWPVGAFEPWTFRYAATAGEVLYLYVTNDSEGFEFEGEFELRVTLPEWIEFDAADGANLSSATVSVDGSSPPWVRDDQFRVIVDDEVFTGDRDYTETFSVPPGTFPPGKYQLQLYMKLDSDVANTSDFMTVTIKKNGNPIRSGSGFSVFKNTNDDPEWRGFTDEYLESFDIPGFGVEAGYGGPRFIKIAATDELTFHCGNFRPDDPPERWIEIQKVRVSPVCGLDPNPSWKISRTESETWGDWGSAPSTTRAHENRLYAVLDMLSGMATGPRLGVWVWELVDGVPEAVNGDMNLGAVGGILDDLRLVAGRNVLGKDLTVMPNGDVYVVWTERGTSTQWNIALAHYDEGSSTWSLISNNVWGHGTDVNRPMSYPSIDNDGEDVYIAWGERRATGSLATPPLGWQWRCKKYDVSGASFSELGTGQGAYPTASSPQDGSFDYPVRLKVSPAGVVWVVWPSLNTDEPSVGGNRDEYPFAWYWDGAAWVDSEVPTPSLVPPDRGLVGDPATYDASPGPTVTGVDAPDNYISFAAGAQFYLDLTFCHHDGPGEDPAIAFQYVYNGRDAITGASQFPGDTSGFAYFEYGGTPGNWDNELYLVEAIDYGATYPQRFVQAGDRSGGVNTYLPVLGGWFEGFCLDNDGARPIFFVQKGYFGSAVDTVYVAKIRADGSGADLLGQGFPTELTWPAVYGGGWNFWTDGGKVVNGTPVCLWGDTDAWFSGFVVAALAQDFTLLSMNWRSGERYPGTRRVLVGDR